MLNDATMFVRYSLMIIVGHFISRGWIEASTSEYFIGAGLAIFAILWKYVEKKMSNK